MLLPASQYIRERRKKVEETAKKGVDKYELPRHD
jgi:hypothetical protein